jgi:hypothetical protein
VKLFPLLLLLFVPVGLVAQAFEVSGTVKDREGDLVPFANVVLLQVSDSSLVKGTSADENGRFAIPGIPPELYFIQARYFGYMSNPVPLDIGKDIQIGALFMEEDREWLDEVVVTAKQPSIERKSDRMVFRVENTVVAQGSTWDIVRNTPGVINVQGRLEIRGQGATIYLNDRKVQLSQPEIQDLLEGLTGTAISSVEIIPNPPASYEAEGGPVLNIITNRNIVPGYKGSFQGTYTQAIYPKYSLGTSHYFKSGKFNVFANYVVNPKKEFKQDDSHINFINELDEVFARWNTELEKTTGSQAQQASLITDYAIDERNTINFTSNLSYSPNRTFDNVVVTEMRNGQEALDSTMNTLSAIENDNTNLAFDLSYEHHLKKEGAILKANAHYTRYNEKLQQEGSSDYFDPSGGFLRNFDFSTDAHQDIDIYTGQLDYYTPLGRGSFESGAKVSVIQTESRIDYFDVNGNQPPFDIALSDNFRYDEKVLAAYLSLLKNWGKWSMKFGLRGEQTHVEGRSISLGSTNTQDYFELFPTFYLLRNFGEEHSLAIDYSRKLRRPNYSDLNPFRYFLNENDYNEGNPDLRPHFSHNFNLNYTFKDTYFFDIYYRDNGKYISTLSFQDNQNQTLRQVRQNVLESISYGIDFTVGTSLTPIWYLYTYSSLFYEEETFLALESAEESATNEVSGFYGFMGNYLTLSKDGSLTGELALTYLSGFLDGSYTLSETVNLNIGIRKSFWKNRAVISVAAEDLLGRANARYTSRYRNQDNSYLPKPETRFIRLGFILNLGNYGLTDNERNLGKSERERLENE